jgi:hypothetical protein
MPDALVTHLNTLGYQPMFLPVAGVAPPELYRVVHGRLMRHGPLIDYVRGTRATLTFPVAEGAAPDIRHVHTSRKRLGATVKFLNEALRCLGVSITPDFKLSALRDTHLVFSISGITTLSVSTGLLVDVLNDLKKALTRFGPEDGELHIVHEYLYAERLLIRRKARRDDSIHLSVTDLAEHFGALGIDARMTKEDEDTLTFASPRGERVACAYRAGYLKREDKLWKFLPNLVVNATAGGVEEGLYIPAPGVALRVEEAEPLLDDPSPMDAG